MGVGVWAEDLDVGFLPLRVGACVRTWDWGLATDSGWHVCYFRMMVVGCVVGVVGLDGRCWLLGTDPESSSG